MFEPVLVEQVYSLPPYSQSVSTAVLYETLKTRKVQAADCTRAYLQLQAMLLMEEDTYAVSPPESWLEECVGRSLQAIHCESEQSLYGHPFGFSLLGFAPSAGVDYWCVWMCVLRMICHENHQKEF